MDIKGFKPNTIKTSNQVLVKTTGKVVEANPDKFSTLGDNTKDEFKSSVKGMSQDAILAKATSHNSRLNASSWGQPSLETSQGAPSVDKFVLDAGARAKRLEIA